MTVLYTVLKGLVALTLVVVAFFALSGYYGILALLCKMGLK